MTGLLILAILGVASAGQFGHVHQPQNLYQPPVAIPAVSPPQICQPTRFPIRTSTSHINGVLLIDGHPCVLRDGQITVTGPLPLPIGECGLFEIGPGYGNSFNGERFQINGGRAHLRSLSPSDVQGLRHALAQSGLTYEQFVQQTGTVSLHEGVMVITSGVISINGVNRNFGVGVFIVVGRLVVEPATGQDVTVTVTAAHVTRPIRQRVTLTKTTTLDRYITISSPVYNRVAATITNFVKHTVAVPEDQVIRSTLPGRVVVNTVPGSTQVVLTVTDTATQFFVQTSLDTVTSTLQHLTPNYNFRTVTINNPQTSTVVRVITRTSVHTAYVTNTVGRTIYSTTTAVFTVTEPAPVINQGGYY